MILRFPIFAKVFPCNEFYLENCPMDFWFHLHHKIANFILYIYHSFHIFKANLLILRFPIFAKVFPFNEFYLENHPSDFWFIYTIKLQIFFSIFIILSIFLKQTFWFYIFWFPLKFFPLTNFILRTVHWILESFTP